MAKKKLVWCIKCRHNPQFNKPYYVKMGALSRSEIREKEKASASSYGSNYYYRYETEEEYNAAIQDLLNQGYNIH